MLAKTAPKGAIGLDTLRLLTLAVPSLLLLGALGSEVIGGLHPCEMCIWQRWPHGIAAVLALGAMVVHTRPELSRKLTLAAIVMIAVSGAIAVFHAGVEQKWWEGLTTCTAGGGSTMDDIFNAPLVRCDEILWSWMGLSLAGWNAVISLGSAAILGWLTMTKVAR
ncbi:disulfide bond formation protein B [Sphingomicrobium clamense]|uniref:Disulfide bond formation protein B n=1 Tax=Sphingomicrobium clamense TaxID=2851013 RepID=A0ABS6V4K2_9SPHN|nr:disulfide bond formation protein B [Sphingomicrobium sp. B8]MBW0144290.1 disulfide bond formation protein B [Sphingomicrobium sp. B8]